MKYITALIAILCFIGGYASGSYYYTREMNQRLSLHIKQIASLIKYNESLKEDYNKLLISYDQDIINTKKIYEEKIKYIESVHIDSMQQFSTRTDYYRQLSETSSSKCRDIADLTTRYDRIISEGITLVEELQATLELRDQQIQQLGKQLQLDRKFVNE